MADLKKQFGDRVRELRRSRALSQAELGERADVNDKYLGEIERGEGNPSLEVIGRLAQALEVPMSTLIGDDILAMGRSELAAEVAFRTTGMTDEQLRRLVRMLRIDAPEPARRAN